MSEPKPDAEAMDEFMRHALGGDPPWWAKAVAEQVYHADKIERLRVHATRGELSGRAERRRLILQDPAGRLVLAEAMEPKP